ncbi:MAG: multicopper oxidase family protein [Deltaproteobacteria bacterium]|nr:MAG: multicopper oxidase family protein [Deltaproteobacteria bacterium]
MSDSHHAHDDRRANRESGVCRSPAPSPDLDALSATTSMVTTSGVWLYSPSRTRRAASARGTRTSTGRCKPRRDFARSPREVPDVRAIEQTKRPLDTRHRWPRRLRLDSGGRIKGIHMVRLLPLALLFACQPAEEDEAVPLPTVWGLETLPDQDPAEDVVEVNLVATEGQATIDGIASTLWGYNSQVPGPLLQARVGDTVRVNFANGLSEPTTVHWHGLRIDNAMDGVPALQEPVQPGDSFTYEFVVPDSGTFWYHPHVRGHEQVERGLQGAMVIHEEEPLAYDVERYFVLDDILLDEDNRLAGGFDPVGGMTAMHGRLGNTLLFNGQLDPLQAEVAAATRERWRVVNTANARTLSIDVADAAWQVIAVDGTLLTEPWPGVGPIRLEVGRRYDLEVIPEAGAELQVVVPTTTGDAAYPAFQGALVGDGESPDFLFTRGPAPMAMDDVEQELTLTLDAANGQYGVEFMINGLRYGEGDAIPVDVDTPTRIVIEETTGLEHPFHLHGQFFRLVSRDGGGPFVPGSLDTLLVDGGERVELYTDFSNPGRWMAHCHILEHAETGMMTEFDVR